MLIYYSIDYSPDGLMGIDREVGVDGGYEPRNGEGLVCQLLESGPINDHLAAGTAITDSHELVDQIAFVFHPFAGHVLLQHHTCR